MNTINEQEFTSLCIGVHRDAGAILDGATDPSQRTSKLLFALFERVCERVQIDCKKQMAELGDTNGFALLQTLEEHMEPEFFYSRILDEYLLTAA
jgi:hypothetical protein